MQALDMIIETILRDARAAADAILAQAEADASQARERHEQALLRERERLLDRALDGAAQIARRAQSADALEAQKADLLARRGWIDDAFVQALAALCAHTGAQSRALLLRLLAAAALEGEQRLIPAAPMRALFDTALLEEAAAAAAQRGVRARFTVAGQDESLSGGFVLESGDIRIDCSWDALLGQMRASLEPKVAALFARAAQGA